MKKKSGKIKGLLMDFLLFNLGSLAYGTAVSVFTAPNDIAPGGLTGISTMISYLSGRYLSVELPIGMLILALNIPLMVVAFAKFGPRMAWRTLAGIVLSSVWTDVLAMLLPPFEGDRMLVCIFGGALMGLGLGLIFSRGGTTGGSDIVARLLERRWPHIPIGRLILLVDGLVIALSGLVYGHLENPLFAVVLVFVSAQVTDWLVYGGRRGKMALVFVKEPAALAKRVIEELGRGATLLRGEGAYTRRERDALLCAVRPEEVFTLKRLVYEEDPDAFVMLLSTDEVLGLGFRNPTDM